jgi:DNA-binding MarR family transcriptional regulator
MRQVHAPGELTLSELTALSRLDREGPMTPGRLAAEERVKPQAMGATLAVLEERGVVERAPDPSDGRRVLMSVAPAGRRLMAERRSVSTQRMAAALAEGLDAAEQRRLVAVIPLLERLADQL